MFRQVCIGSRYIYVVCMYIFRLWSLDGGVVPNLRNGHVVFTIPTKTKLGEGSVGGWEYTSHTTWGP